MTDHAIQNARGHAESITAIMEAMKQAKDGEPVEYEGEIFGDVDSLRERAEEMPLEISVRSGWHNPCDTDQAPEEYLILLSTGGPALRITGDLEGGEAVTAELQWQDWGTLWTRHHDTTTEEDAAILEYAQLFYFG